MNVSATHSHLKGLLFIVPVHPPKYDFAYAFLQTVPTDVDVALIFTTRAELSAFDVGLLRPNMTTVVMEHYVPLQAIALALHKNAMPSFKKFFALSLFAQKYEYLPCVDAEVRFLPGKGFSEIYASIANYYNGRQLYAGLCSPDRDKLAVDIMTESARAVGRFDAMRAATHDFTAYFWFSDIPVYRSDDFRMFARLPLPGLESYMDMVQGLSWYTFEYILYAYFLVEERGWRINVLPGLTWSLEHVDNYAEYAALLQKGQRPGFTWVWSRVMEHPLPPECVHPSIFMTYHHDR